MTKNQQTQLISSGRRSRYCQGSVNPVIQRASSIVFDSFAQKHQAELESQSLDAESRALYYGRRGTVTHFAFQEAMVELEGGVGCYLYPSGAAAIAHCLLAFVNSSDEILLTAGAYQPTQALCQHLLVDLNVSTHYFDPLIGADIASLVTAKTAVVFLEAPSSITMEVPDIPAIVAAVRAANPHVVIMMDNTWSAGVLFKPLSYDIDISIQSATKYIIGHSDAMLGTAVANARTWSRLQSRSYLMGQIADPDTVYMAARGLRTLALRLAAHQQSSLHVARWLLQREEVASVYHPMLPQHPGHAFFKRDFSGANGLFSFALKQSLTSTQLTAFLDHFQHFKMAFSWGGYESLILSFQPDEIKAIRHVAPPKLTGTLFRLHVGLENVNDLVNDLEAGFARIAN